MSEGCFERFRKVLRTQIEGIAESVAPLTQCFTISADDQADDLDFASAKAQQFLALRLYERKEKFEEKIGGVERSIEQGNFGICRECREPIDAERLAARPMTTFCVLCKTKLEKEEDARRASPRMRVGRLHLLARFA